MATVNRDPAAVVPATLRRPSSTVSGDQLGDGQAGLLDMLGLGPVAAAVAVPTTATAPPDPTPEKSRELSLLAMLDVTVGSSDDVGSSRWPQRDGAVAINPAFHLGDDGALRVASVRRTNPLASGHRTNPG